MESVGVPLCEKYRLSKGKSLNAFIHEADGYYVDKLLFDLLRYYEVSYGNFERETVPDEFGNVQLDCGVDYSVTYKKCKAIAEKENPQQYAVQAANIIKAAFSSDYITDQMNLMLSMQEENPTEAIGKAKELIESCCKAILEANGQQWDKNWDVPQLVDTTMKFLEITPKHIKDDVKAADTIKAILGNLRGIASKIAELRNPYGSGHGKEPGYKGLEARHAKLAVGSSLTLVNYLWDSHLWKEAKRHEV